MATGAHAARSGLDEARVQAERFWAERDRVWEQMLAEVRKRSVVERR